MQEVPIYSAVKVNGKRLYEYANTNAEFKAALEDMKKSKPSAII